MRKRLALICSIALIVTVLLFGVFGKVNYFDYTTQVAAGLTLLLIPLWWWALKPKVKKILVDDKHNNSKVEQIQISPDDSLINKLSKDNVASKKVVKQSIYLPDLNEPEKLSFDNSLLDEVYEEALKKASSIFSDCILSGLSIQVYPYGRREKENYVLKSGVRVYFHFYSKNADKNCLMTFDEIDGLEHSNPDEDASAYYERTVFSKVPWKEVNWKVFLSKAYDKVKPLSTSELSYYDIMIYACDKELPWSIEFFDNFNGRRRAFKWDGKGKEEKSVNLVSV